jgi:2-polyprenyl-6-hydroxyphenyl methylase/3-demethylubiquinone-9 3-methyltransferase
VLKKIRWNIAQFFELIWWQQYLRKRSVDEYLTWKKKYWTDFLTTIEWPAFDFFKPHLRVLDLGCGPAGIFINYANHPITAVDPLIAQYEQKIAHFSKQRYPHICFVESTIEDFQSPEKYDLIFCINCVNHVMELEKAIQKLYDITEEGGYCVVSIDSHKYRFLKTIFSMIPGDILHPHQHTKNEYTQLIRKNKFNISKEICLKSELIFDYYVFVLQKSISSPG